ncbi:hypothetical protein H5410_035909 [Solanum commersonii]|uniref:Uncharacterized protein n=1 Tax=Solanum commersonii TaxID=4109 RepID=A0A9J5Y381_SOLCO|nr:hypothetical protein H5410_035909 [Solanum commersonii]
MDANVQAASKDPNDLQQTPAQSRYKLIHFRLTRYTCVIVTLYTCASSTAYLNANVHVASMDTKDLKQTQYRYTFIHFPLTRYACAIVTLYNGAYSKPAIDANQLSGMDPTAHTKNPGHSRCILYSRILPCRGEGRFSAVIKGGRLTIVNADEDTDDPTYIKNIVYREIFQNVSPRMVQTEERVLGKNGEISSESLTDLKPGDERTEIRNTAPPDFSKSIETEEITSLREKGNLNKDEDASLSENLSDTFINIILPVQAD